jgi:hypothetical protein
MKSSPTISVITSSIGRPELRRCIESVKEQTVKCRHYVYVNGLKWMLPAHEIIQEFPHINAMYLPEETGDCGYGHSMSGVFAAAPFLTESDFIFYLNDDDFYDSNHVESLVCLMQDEKLGWAYSLRRFVDIRGNPVCEDDWDSLGYWPNAFDDNSFLVDNSCYAMRRSTARAVATHWTQDSRIADRLVLRELKHLGLPYGCSGISTVNYRLGTGTATAPEALYHECARRARNGFPEGFPWRKGQSVFRPETT